MSTPETRIVQAWHEALNARDADRLIELSHPDVEVGGPRGSGHGSHILREWVERANIHLEPGRFFHLDGTVVVEQEAEWRSSETGEVIGTQTVGTVFAVRDGLITRVMRYDEFAGALEAANLDGSHETGVL